jgi:hypothetical protein
LITNKGRNILAKYLIGQAPAYASFIALGVGEKPLAPGEVVVDYNGNEVDLALKDELKFEALRLPISSRGYVYDDQNNASIVFVGDLPSEQRYEFTEVGIFSAKSNPIAGSLGSRMIYTFAETETWEYHDETLAVGLNTYLEPLYLEEEENIIAVPDVAFRTNTNNALFSGSDIRKETYQVARFLDRALLIKGNMSGLETVDGRLAVKATEGGQYYGSHIHLTNLTPNFNRNSPKDELRLAFTVVDKLDTQAQNIDSVKILIEFAETDVAVPNNYARMEIDTGISETNRYYVAQQSLESLIKSAGFTWSNVDVVKIYVSVYETSESGPVLSDNFYVAFDGLRFENLTSTNPLYGLTGYSVVRNDDAETIIKESNSSNLIEFRFGLDVE